MKQTADVLEFWQRIARWAPGGKTYCTVFFPCLRMSAFHTENRPEQGRQVSGQVNPRVSPGGGLRCVTKQVEICSPVHEPWQVFGSPPLVGKVLAGHKRCVMCAHVRKTDLCRFYNTIIADLASNRFPFVGKIENVNRNIIKAKTANFFFEKKERAKQCILYLLLRQSKRTRDHRKN